MKFSKRIPALLTALSLLFCLAACGAAETVSVSESFPTAAPADEPAAAPAEETEAVEDAEEIEEIEEVPEEDPVDDEAWDAMGALGNVETENGLFFVTITVPADLVGGDVTQEELDAQEDGTFLSAVLNEDGSVTYRLTKQQHKAMLDDTAAEIDAALSELAADDSYAFTAIEHNADYSHFDVYLSTDELGLMESFTVAAFYSYGAMYALMAGRTSDNVTVSFYNAGGTLINTADSADYGG